MRRLTLISVLMMTVSGCATLGSDDQGGGLVLGEGVEGANRELVRAVATNGLATYRGHEAEGRVEWVACKHQSSAGNRVFAVMHDEDEGLPSNDFCIGWQAQTFLAAGYHVVGVNRPGFGRSTGDKDFAGPKSVKAIREALRDAAKKDSAFANIFGIWGHGSGAIAAGFLAKNSPSLNIQWLVMGNGIYDTEEAQSTAKDAVLVGHIERFVEEQGEDGHEDRSLSWMADGLPSQILMYHGEDNLQVPLSTVQTFRDTLVTSQYQVRLEPIKGAGHVIAPAQHRQVLEIVLQMIK